MTTPLVSIVLPAYNCESFICHSVNEALEFFSEIGINGEVVVVDDGSEDNTFQSIPDGDNVKAIKLSPNKGKGAAIRAGMLAAEGRVCIFTDADIPYGTYPIIIAIYYILERNFHAMIGDRTLPGSSYTSSGLIRKGLSSLASFFFGTLIVGGIYDTQCGFKGFRREVAQEIFSLTKINRFATDVEIIYLLLKHHLDIKRIPVQLLKPDCPSTIRPVLDSLQVIRDIVRLELNKRQGLYHSKQLESILNNDFRTASNYVIQRNKSIKGMR